MDVKIREVDGVTILDVQGRIMGSDSLELKSIIDQVIASKAEGEAKLLLNLAKVPMMDSSGLGVVVAAYTSVQRKKGRVALLNLGRSTRQLIVMAKLMTIFETYDNEDDAVASF
ncbi:MAG: STAS domain-containing protein [Deltaproteobacteria bacterium]|nr:STAS domain-containing protein [Deltaproteobacteria bacterium]